MAMTIRKVGVVGCGLMGGGIAQACVQCGYETIMHEVILDKGMARIHSAWDNTMVSKGKITQGQADENCSRLHGTLNLEDLPSVMW